MKKLVDYYEVASSLFKVDRDKFHLSILDISPTNRIKKRIDIWIMAKKKINHYSQSTSGDQIFYEFRPPLIGEWYLSGSHISSFTLEAYRAPDQDIMDSVNLNISHYIAELVMVEKKTTVQYKEITI